MQYATVNDFLISSHSRSIYFKIIAFRRLFYSYPRQILSCPWNSWCVAQGRPDRPSIESLASGQSNPHWKFQSKSATERSSIHSAPYSDNPSGTLRVFLPSILFRVINTPRSTSTIYGSFQIFDRGISLWILPLELDFFFTERSNRAAPLSCSPGPQCARIRRRREPSFPSSGSRRKMPPPPGAAPGPVSQN